MSKPTLAELKAFMAVAEHRSFRRAADLMGVTRSSLSHTIRGLEDRLKARLLHRTTRSVSLTDAGQRLLTRLAPLMDEFDAVLEDVADEQGKLTGDLRINGSEGAIRLLLQDIVPEFMSRYPDVTLDLVAEGRLVDIVEQGFDAGIRLGEAMPQDMIAVRLSGDLRFLAVASPEYLATHPAPKTPDELVSHQCVRQRLPSGKRYRWEFSYRGQEVAVDVPGKLTLDNTQLMVEAAEKGLGIAYVPEDYALSGLESGRLVAVLKEWCPVIPGLFIYFSGNRHLPASLRAFINLVREKGV